MLLNFFRLILIIKIIKLIVLINIISQILSLNVLSNNFDIINIIFIKITNFPNAYYVEIIISIVNSIITKIITFRDIIIYNNLNIKN